MPKAKNTMKTNRPDEVVLFEKELGIKFKGPYSDGREWDAVLPAKGAIDSMVKIGELAKWLQEKGFKKPSNEINSTFAVKVSKDVHVGIDSNSKGWQITMYYE